MNLPKGANHCTVDFELNVNKFSIRENNILATILFDLWISVLSMLREEIGSILRSRTLGFRRGEKHIKILWRKLRWK